MLFINILANQLNIMLFTTAALGITSAGAGYYIYRNHPDEFKETVFNKTVEAYTAVKTTSHSAYNRLHRAIRGDQPDPSPFTIEQVKIIQPDTILTLPTSAYSDLTWSEYHPQTMIHVIYTYQSNQYRIVFSYQQDLSILTTNTKWLSEGFHNGIDTINSNLLAQDQLWELIHQYAGPLGDFYTEAKHLQNGRGFLSQDCTQRLITDPENKFIRVTNILGEVHRFPAKSAYQEERSERSERNVLTELTEKDEKDKKDEKDENKCESDLIQDSIINNITKSSDDNFF